jgi:molybdopterin synthase sulfur carrier subunit
VSVRVQMPPILRAVTAGERWMEGDGATIAAVLADLAKKHPALGLHLFDEHGAIRRNIVCLHDGQAVRGKDAGARSVKPGDDIVLTNALAGG